MTTKTTRRAILAGAAALPALSLPALASKPKVSVDEARRLYAKMDPEIQAFFRALAKEHDEAELADQDTAAPDPIFAAIERQKKLWGEWDYETHPEPSHGSPEYEAWDQWQHAAGDAYNNGLRAMLKMKPQTREGAAALIAYCLAEESGMFGSDAPDSEAVNERRLLRTIAKAIPDLA